MLLLALLLVVGASLLGGWASWTVKRQFATNQAIPNQAGLSGAEVARAILRQEGLEEIPVEKVAGTLSDHYDPRAMVLRLSEPVYEGRSVAALGVAAHECGHALQQLHRFVPLSLRSLTVPTARLGSYLGLPLIMLGLVLRNPFLAAIGMVFYLLVVVFQLITLPVEIDASKRALASLDSMNLLRHEQEVHGVTAVLNAAALTYVAAALAGLATLFYYATMFFGGRRS